LEVRWDRRHEATTRQSAVEEQNRQGGLPRRTRSEAKKKRRQHLKAKKRKGTQCVGIGIGVEPTKWLRGTCGREERRRGIGKTRRGGKRISP